MKHIRKIGRAGIGIIMGIIVLFKGCSGQRETVKSPTVGVTHLNAMEAAEYLRQHTGEDSFVILDVRTQKEFEQGHSVNPMSII